MTKAENIHSSNFSSIHDSFFPGLTLPRVLNNTVNQYYMSRRQITRRTLRLDVARARKTSELCSLSIRPRSYRSKTHA